MSNGAVIDTTTAAAALGQGLKVPDEHTHKQFTAGIGPKGEKVKTVVDEYTWDEVAVLQRIEHSSDEDETWGLTSKINLGVKVSDDPMYQSINKSRWVSNGFNAMRLAVKPYEFTDDELKELMDDSGNPHQWAIMRRREGDAVLRLMGSLLRATGRSDLLVGKKTFVGFTDAVIELLDSEQLIGELVKARIVSTLNRQTGVREEHLVGFSAV